MKVRLTERGKRIRLLIIGTILFGLGMMGIIPTLSNFLVGVCFGMIYLSLRREESEQ